MTNQEMIDLLSQTDSDLFRFLTPFTSGSTIWAIKQVRELIAQAVHHLKSDNYCGWVASLIWEAATGAIKVLRTVEHLDKIPRLQALSEHVSARALNS